MVAEDLVFKWRDIGLDIAESIARQSKDPKTKVGATLLDRYGNFASTGYNGFPPNFPDLPELWDDEVLKHMFVIHAEVNCLLRVEDWGRVEGGTLFCSERLCIHCLTLCESRGIAQVVIRRAALLRCQNKQWYREQKEALAIFEQYAKLKQLVIP